MKILLSFIFFLFAYLSTNAQNNFRDDYSSNIGWTQIGSNVEIRNGKLNYFNGSADSQQRRVYKDLGFTLDSNSFWSAEFDFTPTLVGNWGGPSTGHSLLALTAGIQEPFNNCPDIPCTGNPIGTQDGIIVSYTTTSPIDSNSHIANTIFFIISAKDSNLEYRSVNALSGTTLNTNYYLRLERFSPTSVQLSVFLDSNKTIHLPNSPISLNIPSTIGGLNTVQHANLARGDSRRQLSGSIDNLTISSSNFLTSIPTTQSSSLGLTIYPNPAKETITIEGIEKGTAIQFFNIAGQLVMETMNKPNISISKLNPGVYFVQIEKNGSVQTQKFIVE
ncbi:MAG: T9SS type A sorting domain-containing protein [Flavobacteriales bacterium]|nr:T9SS type A sorting domain-containing protein [Flavobacteriales bacterium]